MNDRCLVNFSSFGRENYLGGSQRLLDNCATINLDADLLFFSPDSKSWDNDVKVSEDSTLLFRRRYPRSKEFGDCPIHLHAPYAFKAYCIQEALDMGYKKVMWMDSSVVFFKYPEVFWRLAEDVGVVVFDNPGCPEAFYTSDDCLEHMGCTAEEANKFWMVSAGMIVLDFNEPITKTIFDFYFEHSRDSICLLGKSGSTRKEFIAHRHDQSILSYICHREYVHHLNYGSWAYYSDILNGRCRPTIGVVGMSQAFGFEKVIKNMGDK